VSDGDVLARIDAALARAAALARQLMRAPVEFSRKPGGSPVSTVDLALDAELRRALWRPGEGWLSEESADDPGRLDCASVWVVDPIDGTRELLEGVDEWAISVAFVDKGRPVAGGVCNPARGRTVLGGRDAGIRVDGGDREARREARTTLAGARVLASRSEVARGEWERFRDAPFTVRPTGSVAYKLALVAAGLAEATWTLRPKHEWDVAAGVALVLAAGGEVWLPGGAAPEFNRPCPRIPGLFAAGPGLGEPIRRWLAAAGNG
jgi:myo-inositol-1(or 4)-monophosphatase